VAGWDDNLTGNYLNDNDLNDDDLNDDDTTTDCWHYVLGQDHDLEPEVLQIMLSRGAQLLQYSTILGSLISSINTRYFSPSAKILYYTLKLFSKDQVLELMHGHPKSTPD
jgi:hypothetical protein